MAEGYLKSFGPELEVFSAGTNPADKVNPNAVKVMMEEGIDISGNRSNDVSEFLDDSFDYVITVCDNAKETCPAFTGKVMHRLHLGFVDPADARGTAEQILSEYREVRDEIKIAFQQLYDTKLK